MTTQDLRSGTAPAATQPGSTDHLLPLASGRWQLDRAHSSIVFSIRHLGLSRVRGRFDRFEAWLEVGASLDDSRIEATVDMASVDTNNTDRDNHLRSAEFFDVENFPEMRFVSNRITGADDDWRLEGTLTVLDQTRPFALDVEFHGIESFGEERHAGFSVTGELRRSEFGLDFGLAAAGGVLLGDAVKFELDLQFLEPASP